MFFHFLILFIICGKCFGNIRKNSAYDEDNVVYYDEIAKYMDKFHKSDVDSFSTILFDPENFQAIFGARNYIFRLSLVGLQLLESSEWGSNETTASVCVVKGQKHELCHNFVTVLEKSQGKLYVCGTNAFSPVCSWRSLTSINKVTKVEKGVGRSPFSPAHSVTSLMTSRGDFYVGTSLDFLGHDRAFLRLRGANGWVRTPQANEMWLSKPEFVSAFEESKFVYFGFNEDAVDTLQCGQTRLPRLGRVCKDDPGGALILKKQWTTLLKATLNCSVPGTPPFGYESLKGLSFVDSEQTLFALFSTHEAGVAGSAICAFSLDSIEAAFHGPFKYQESPSGPWLTKTRSEAQGIQAHQNHYLTNHSHVLRDYVEQHNRDIYHFNCMNNGRTSHDGAKLADKYQLMSDSIRALTDLPIITIDFKRGSHIVVDAVRTRQSGVVYVVFVADEEGFIQKWTTLSYTEPTVTSETESKAHIYRNWARNPSNNSPRPPKTCLLETFEVFPKKMVEKIHVMKFLKETNSIYLGTDSGAIRLTVARCEKFKTRHSCLASRDPYCGWDTNVLMCTLAPQGNPFSTSWIQHVIGCPSQHEPVDGGWGVWSNWAECTQGGSKYACVCRRRRCNAPTPKRGGIPCIGNDIEVTNCTVHGGWTQWSDWSQCSVSCGVAVTTRRRSCSNPAPQHGGRVCVGADTSEKYCHSLPPCRGFSILEADWSEWGPWSACTGSCGGGLRSRKRVCKAEGCIGCDVEKESCSRDCIPLIEFSEWSSWISGVGDNIDGKSEPNSDKRLGDGSFWENSIDNNPADSEYSKDEKKNSILESQEMRVRAKCQAKITSSGLKIDQVAVVTEVRDCPDSNCSPKEIDLSIDGSALAEWSKWSECSSSCDGGTQERFRTCEGRCENQELKQERRCNEFPCRGTWSCWGEWTTCPTSCGGKRMLGTQERSRDCVVSPNSIEVTSGCPGVGTETKECPQFNCAGELSSANRQLINDDAQISCVSVGTFIGACLASLSLGAVFGAVCLRAWLKMQKNTKTTNVKPATQSQAPRYLTAKPNQYVTVPGYKGSPAPLELQEWTELPQWGDGDVVHWNEGDVCQWKDHCIHQWNEGELPLTPLTPSGTIKKGFSALKSAGSSYPLTDYESATLRRSHNTLAGGGAYPHGNGYIRADLDSDRIFFN